MATILLIGTLDTKGMEFAYVRDLILERGHQTIVIDAGVAAEPAFPPDITAEAVAEAGGTKLTYLREAQDRGAAISAMSAGAAKLTAELYTAGKIDGILSLGGSGGTSIASTAMQALPVGFPKVMVSTLTSGDVSPFVGVKDLTMMYSVVDVAGLNRISRRVFANAVGAVCGMVEQPIPEAEDKPIIAATMFGVTTPCVTSVRQELEAHGYEVLVFHATGSGGRAMEGLIADGYVRAVADITTTEWCDELVGGVLGAGPTRLDAAAKAGIPQVVSCGALDMVNFWGIETVPAAFKDRNLYRHNDQVTLMRTTTAECAELGKIIAQKLNQATGPVTFFIPLKGVSMIDAPGQPFYSPEADAALFDALREGLDRDKVTLIELDYHINDPLFAASMSAHLLELIKNQAGD